jgi:branched-subunit amino acid transport protein
MSPYILTLILGMAAATYIPRALPAVLTDKMSFSPKVEKFLSLIPYTAMAALIFPGVLTVNPQHMSVGLLGAAVAAVLAWKKLPIAIVVMGAILADMILYLFL